MGALRQFAAFAVAALVLSACSDDPPAVQSLPTTTTEESDEPFATTSTAPTTTPPTAPPLGTDPFAVPNTVEEITEEYVEAVLNELARVDGDALRLSRDGNIMTMESLALLRAAYAPAELQTQIDIFVDAATAGFAGMAAIPGDRIFSVDRLLTVGLQCIGAEVTVDFSPVGPGAPTDSRSNIELRRAESSLFDENPTVWQIGRSRILTEAPPVGQPCA